MAGKHGYSISFQWIQGCCLYVLIFLKIRGSLFSFHKASCKGWSLYDKWKMFQVLTQVKIVNANMPENQSRILLSEEIIEKLPEDTMDI